MLQRVFSFVALAWIAGSLGAPLAYSQSAIPPTRPNILIAISDDQSWPHASAYGSKMVETPNFDRIAQEGVLFTQAFCASPGCSPSRAALLTGRNTWQLEHAGTHGSYFHPKYETFPDRLSESGYFVGHVGKGWGPGDFKHLGRETNPAGPAFSTKGSGPNKWSGYADGFRNFLEQRPEDTPFCFWFGSGDPHRGYKKGSGLAKGKELSDAEVPPFLPDTPEIRSDMLDYAFEVERFDTNLGEIMTLLRETGELENTLVIVTSDNGIPMPRAKANCYEYGIHMPLAIRWPNDNQTLPPLNTLRTVDDLVGFVDLTATIYDVTNVAPPTAYPIAGKSLRPILESDRSGILDSSRRAVFGARERHSSSRFNSLSYPQRFVRDHKYLYIRNLKPKRWPAGPRQKYVQVTYAQDGSIVQSIVGPEQAGYHDIDSCPSLTFLIDNRNDPKIRRFLELSVGKRPAEELFDIRSDPGCLTNLADSPQMAETKKTLSKQLNDYLVATNDARMTSDGDIWETYPRVSGLRWFPEPDWATQDPTSVPKQDWIEQRRPR